MKRASRVALGSLGGTITMSPQSAGGAIVPTLSAEDLTAGVPGLSEIANLEVQTLSQSPSAWLTTSDVVKAVGWARDRVDAGCTGVVMVQGTDTLEEAAYLAELLWDRDEPLVFTGAMRGPAQPSADGSANLLAAACAATCRDLRGMGVTVVLDDTIHLASRVRKTHSFSLSAFRSPGGGPIGRVVEGLVRLEALPSRPNPLFVHDEAWDFEVFVPLLETYLGDDGSLLAHVVQSGVSGVVIAAFGAGHLSLAAAQVVSEAAARVPVVISTRTGAGGTLAATYGFGGSETDLVQRGALLSGRLDARKARTLLWVLKASGASQDVVATQFSIRGPL